MKKRVYTRNAWFWRLLGQLGNSLWKSTKPETWLIKKAPERKK